MSTMRSTKSSGGGGVLLLAMDGIFPAAADVQREAVARVARPGAAQGRAPRRVTTVLPSALPASRAADRSDPLRHFGRKPAAKASPAPVESTTSTRGAGRRRTSGDPRSATSAPAAPSLTTTRGKEPARATAASAGSAQPVRTVASAAFAKTASTPAIQDRNVDGPTRCSGPDEAVSTDTVLPAAAARRTASSAAARAPALTRA